MLVRINIKKYIRTTIKIILFVVVFVCICNIYVEVSTKEKTYNTVTSIPKNAVGLVLGTSKYLSNGRTNLFYTYRLQAAINLYKSGKVKYILVSGDNGSTNYDEPSTFKKDLLAAGIPENVIYLDYAGFRTLDSVIRAKEIFGVTQVTIISQQFHNERAIAIASTKGIKAIGFNAKNVGGRNGLKVKIREVFARVAMCLDLITNKKPKFLGEKIPIPS